MYLIKQTPYKTGVYAMIVIECPDDEELKKIAGNIEPIIQEMGYIVEKEFKND